MSLWDTTALPGLFQRYHEGDGTTFHIEKMQDVQPILERNKRLQTHDDGFNADRTGYRIASIPMIVWLQWIKEGMNPADEDDVERWLRLKLNDPEWRYLRTSEARL